MKLGQVFLKLVHLCLVFGDNTVKLKEFGLENREFLLQFCKICLHACEVSFSDSLLFPLGIDDLETLSIVFDRTNPCTQSSCGRRFCHHVLRSESSFLGEGFNLLKRLLLNVLLVKFHDILEETGII